MEMEEVKVKIQPLNIRTVVVKIRGTAPYVQHKWSQKAKELLRKHHTQEIQKKKGGKREPKDMNELFEGAQHRAREGWNGIPAASFRAALVSACRLINFHMTLAKLCFFVIADGFESDGTPLVKITKGKPRPFETITRIQKTIDYSCRPMWDAGWEADVKVRYDGDQFTFEDIFNLMVRVGEQVGIGEGRNDSRTSCGQGWGSFEVVPGEVVPGKDK